MTKLKQEAEGEESDEKWEVKTDLYTHILEAEGPGQS